MADDVMLWEVVRDTHISNLWIRVTCKIQHALTSPLFANMVAQSYAEIFRDETHTNRIGPAAMATARSLYSVNSRRIIARIKRYACGVVSTEQGQRKKNVGVVMANSVVANSIVSCSIYNSCYSAFPNWVDADTLRGLPPLYPTFQCIWIKRQEIKESYCIGRGTFSTVRKGTYRNTDVVVKSYRPDCDTIFTHVIYEAVTWTHMMFLHVAPPIIGLQDCAAQAPYLPAIVGRYFKSSRTLARLLADMTHFVLPEVTKLLLDAANLISKMHKMHFIHNDIKTDNIIVYLDPDCQNKYTMRLIDFGLTTYQTGLTYNKGVSDASHYRYLAPELMHGHRSSTKSDIYSFGVLVDTVCEHIDSEAMMTWLNPVAARCCANDPCHRPSISDVQDMLCAKWAMMLAPHEAETALRMKSFRD